MASELSIQEKALEIWNSLTRQEQNAVRYGVLPAAVMQKAIAEGYDGQRHQQLAVAIMEIAQACGGMYV